MTKKQKFLRLGYSQYSKLGLRRKNKQKYRKAKGGENKVRLKMKGHLRNVSIGFRGEKETRGLVMGKKPVLIFDVKDLENLGESEAGIVGKIGSLKKINIAEYAVKNNIRLLNLNSKKFLDEMNKEIEERRKERAKKKGRRVEGEKRAKEAEKKKQEEEKKEKEKSEKNKETGLEESVKNNETDAKQNVEETKK